MDAALVPAEAVSVHCQDRSAQIMVVGVSICLDAVNHVGIGLQPRALEFAEPTAQIVPRDWFRCFSAGKDDQMSTTYSKINKITLNGEPLEKFGYGKKDK